MTKRTALNHLDSTGIERSKENSIGGFTYHQDVRYTSVGSVFCHANRMPAYTNNVAMVYK